VGSVVYLYVFLAAVAIGGLVYWLTLRSPAQAAPAEGDGFLPAPPPEPTVAVPDVGLPAPISWERPSWQGRVAGALGLVIMVSLAAVALAFAVFEAGSLVARLIADYAS
jgi:hypothetical protein